MASRRYRVTIGGRELEVEVRRENGAVEVLVDGQSYTATLSESDARGVRRLVVDGQNHEVMAAAPEAGRYLLALEGVALEAAVEDERARRLAAFGGGTARARGRQDVVAPMPGLVVRVNVAPGQAVKAGECLVVLQAMKMENELGSPSDGTVKVVPVEPGQAVEQGQVLVELE